MTKDELLQLIADNITTNGNNEITGFVAASVLSQMVQSIYGVDGMGGFYRFRGVAATTTNPVAPRLGDIFITKFNAANVQTFTNFNSITTAAGELALMRYNGAIWVKASIGIIEGGGGTGSMTAAEIRDALETLTGIERLNKSAVQGIDFPLNFKAKEDLGAYSYLNTTYGNSLKGDLFVAEDLQGDTGLNEADWIIAMLDNPTFAGQYDSSDWLRVKFNNPEIVKARLEALTGAARLNKSAIRGGEVALNRRGSVEWTGTAGQNTIKTGDPLPGDYWVFDDGGSPSESYANGDILILLTSTLGDAGTWDLTDDTKFEIWQLSKLGTGGAMTAEQIAAALNTITVLANMVSANRVKYSASQTVQQKIDAMDVVITGKQGEIFSKRIMIEGEISSFSLVVAGYIHPFQLAVNRVPYVGKEGASFAGELAGFDFRYAHASNVTTITSNPAFTPRLSFNPGDVIDILHSNAALKAEAV